MSRTAPFPVLLHVIQLQWDGTCFTNQLILNSNDSSYKMFSQFFLNLLYANLSTLCVSYNNFGIDEVLKNFIL